MLQKISRFFTVPQSYDTQLQQPITLVVIANFYGSMAEGGER
jgi:hypothetical protein